MERFSLDTWLQDKSRKVVTRDGRSVRILDYNLKGDKHICIAVDDEIQESITTVDEDGHCLRDKTGWHESNFDLFFADEEEELTELQKTLEEDCDCYVNLYNDGKTREELREWIKGWCPRIIDLARKELRKEQQEKLGTLEMPIDVTEPYYIKGKQDAGEAKVKELVAEFEKGRQDALKSLPKWKKAKKDEELDCHVAIQQDDRVVLSDFVQKDEYYITLDVLKTLSKEE